MLESNVLTLRAVRRNARLTFDTRLVNGVHTGRQIDRPVGLNLCRARGRINFRTK
jgi:hypothetical protein